MVWHVDFAIRRYPPFGYFEGYGLFGHGTLPWIWCGSQWWNQFFSLFFVFQNHDFGFGPFLNNPKPGHRREWTLFYEWEPSSEWEPLTVKEKENEPLCSQVSWVIYGCNSSLNCSNNSSDYLNLETKICFLVFLVPSIYYFFSSSSVFSPFLPFSFYTIFILLLWFCSYPLFFQNFRTNYLFVVLMFAYKTLLLITFHLQSPQN